MCGKKITIKNLFQNREGLIIIGLWLLVILLRLPSLEHPFDNDSAANAYHARLMLRGEPLYSSHHPAHHMPAVYYTYALAFLLFGDNLWAVKFLLILWTCATVYLLYRLGTLLIDGVTGALAAVFYAILSAHMWMWGNSAQIELFANLPRIATFLVLMRLMASYPLRNCLKSKGGIPMPPAPHRNAELLFRQSLSARPAATWKFVFVGLLSAGAFLFKAIYLSPLILAGVVLLIDLWPNRMTIGAWLVTLMRGLWIGVGFMAGLLITAGYFAFLGLWPRLWLVFTLGRAYTHSKDSILYTLLYPLVGLGYNNLALLIFSLAGLIIILAKPWRVTSLLLVAIWYILSFIEAGALVGVFRFYYYLLIVPPLALLAAWFLLKIYHDISEEAKTRRDEEIKRPGFGHSFASRIIASPPLPLNRWRAPLILTMLLTIALTISVVQNFNFYYHYGLYKLGYETHREFLLKGSPFGPQLIQLQELADYIQQHTTPTDHIYTWSDDVQLYYLADRRCAIDMIWSLYVDATGPRRRIFAPSTKYVIIDTSRSNNDWLWIYSELKKDYQLETILYEQEIFSRLH